MSNFGWRFYWVFLVLVLEGLLTMEDCFNGKMDLNTKELMLSMHN